MIALPGVLAAADATPAPNAKDKLAAYRKIARMDSPLRKSAFSEP